VAITLGRRVREGESVARRTGSLSDRSESCLSVRSEIAESFGSRGQPRFIEGERRRRGEEREGVARPSVDAFDPGSRDSPLIAFRSTRPIAPATDERMKTRKLIIIGDPLKMDTRARARARVRNNVMEQNVRPAATRLPRRRRRGIRSSRGAK